MPEIEVTHTHGGGDEFFFVRHPFDLSLLDMDSVERPFRRREDAERAAEILASTIAGAVD